MRLSKMLTLSICCSVLIAGSSVWAQEKAQDAQNAQNATSGKIKDANVLPKKSMVKIAPVQAKPKNPAQNIDQLEKQLNEVIKANQRLQEDYLRRMEKIRAISDQAKIHRKILEQIKAQTPQQGSAVQQAIQQEKIRLIAEQARKNEELLKTLRAGQQKSST